MHNASEGRDREGRVHHLRWERRVPVARAGPRLFPGIGLDVHSWELGCYVDALQLP